MKKINLNTTRKGMVLPIILLVILLLVGVGIGGYWLVDNYVLFPDADDNALEAVLEHKFDLGFEYEPAEEQGKVEVAVRFTDDSLTEYLRSMAPTLTDAELKEYLKQLKAEMPYTMNEDLVGGSVSYTKDELMAKLNIMGESVELISAKNDLVIGAGGQYFGISLENFVEDFANSIFAPNSGSYYELPSDAYNQIIEIYHDFMESKENDGLKEDFEILEAVVLDCFKNSKLGECEVKYFGNTFNGSAHAGRSQNFVITKEGAIDFIEVLAARINNLSEEESAAFDRVLGVVNAISEEPIDKASISEALLTLADEAKASESTVSNRFELSVIYVAKNVAAIEINAYSYNLETQEDTHEMYLGVDFGDEPLKNGKTEIIYQTFGEYPESFTIETNNVTENGKTTLSVVMATDIYDYTYDAELDVDVYGCTGRSYVYIDVIADKNEGLLTTSLSRQLNGEDEKTEMMSFVLGFVDSKDSLSFTFKNVKEGEVVTALPCEIVVGFANTPDPIIVPEYDNILDYSESQFDGLMTNIMSFLNSLGGLGGSTSPYAR